MISTYLKQNNSIKKSLDYALDKSTIWIDLFDITTEEIEIIKNFLNINIPTRQEMSQIEASERLYVENDTLYMTILQLIMKETKFPKTHSISFILHKKLLITVSYTKDTTFNFLTDKLYHQSKIDTGLDIFLILLRNIVSKLADVVERVTTNIDSYRRIIFSNNNIHSSKIIDYREILEKIGLEGDLLSKSRESLFLLTRSIQYAQESLIFNHDEDKNIMFKTLLTDINSIVDFSQFLSNDISFILEATLMPELQFSYGYPTVILAMLFSIFLTYKYFKRKKWL